MPHGKTGRKLLKNGEIQDNLVSDQLNAANMQPITSSCHSSNDSDINSKEGQQFFHCCTPKVCKEPGVLIGDENPGNAVRVLCNNEECSKSRWMHQLCFEGKPDPQLNMVSG